MDKNDLFNYVEIKGDPTKQEVLDRERFYGYVPSKPLILDFDTYAGLHDSIINDKAILFSEQSLGQNASKEKLKSSISIWEDLDLKLHEIHMLDIPFDDVEEGELTMTPEFEDIIKPVSPFELPIFFNREKRGEVYAELQSICLASSSRNLKDNIKLYAGISLSKLSHEITVCLYHHEIAHTQLDSWKSCNNLLDLETLPILIEEIFASKIDASGRTLEKLRNIRLLELIKFLFIYMATPNMAYSNRIASDGYIKSILQAISLMNIYLTGSGSMKKEIQNYINRIFAEQASVQDMLNHFHSNMDETPKVLQKLKVPR